MRLLILLTIGLFSSIVVTAQNIPAIDSLVNKGKNLVDEDQDKSLEYSYKAYKMSAEKDYYWGQMNAAQWISEAYSYKGLYDSSYKYDDIALGLSRAQNDLPEIANNLVAKAQKKSYQGKKADALKLFFEAEEIMMARKDTFDLADLYLRVGGTYTDLDQTAQAMEYFDKSRKFSEALGNLEEAGWAVSDAATIQKKIGNFDKAIEMLEQSLAFFEEKNSEYSILIALNNLGVLYKDTDQLQKSLEAYQRAEKLDVVKVDARIPLGLADNKGILFNKMGRYRDAEKELRKAIEIGERLGIKETTSDARAHLAKTLYHLGQKKEAFSQLQESLELSQEIGALEKQKDAHEIGKEIYRADGNIAKALYHAEALQVVKDSIYQTEKSRQINALQTLYETEKKDAEISLLNKNAELEKTKRNGLIAGLVLLALAAAAWIRNLFNKRKKLLAENALELQKRLNAEQELEFKHKELTTKVLQLARKNEFLGSLESEIESLKSNVDQQVNSTSRKITRLIKKDIEDDKQWEQFDEEFKNLHKGFIENLTQKHGSYSQSELRLISLLKMNLSSKDIADTLNISAEGIKKARYRLRKKLNLNTDDDLQGYLTGLG